MHRAPALSPCGRAEWSVSNVPPSAGPRLGNTVGESAAAATNLKLAVVMQTVLPTLLTPTVTLPGVALGALQVTMLDDTHRARTRCDEPSTHASWSVYAKCCPHTVMVVPPSAGPWLGSTRCTCASATYRYTWPSALMSEPSLPVTSTATSPSSWLGALHRSTLELITSAATTVCAAPNTHAVLAWM